MCQAGSFDLLMDYLFAHANDNGAVSFSSPSIVVILNRGVLSGRKQLFSFLCPVIMFTYLCVSLRFFVRFKSAIYTLPIPFFSPILYQAPST